jgi:predicted acylesterase/phospholipase RssA
VVASAFAGKIGLALSGGGFRAALFHIGVLARLAECVLLRRIEYFSCVSGGSIIGAHFYLELRKLLTEKPDDAITRADYVQIVQKVEKDFLDGVQRNIRTRVAAEWLTNLKMIFLPNYSRTIRVGELCRRS